MEDTLQRFSKTLKTGLLNDKDLDKLKVGQLVKVGNRYESFWVLLTKVEDDSIYGTIDNNLLGFPGSYGQEIQFKKENVYQIGY